MPKTFESHQRFAAALLGVFVVVWVGLAIRPWYRDDWLLENVLVFVLLPILIASRRRLPLSRLSYSCLFVFLCLHEVGAHYTYAQVPYDVWAEWLLGQNVSELFGWQRNHFDRLVHLLYGLLLTYPVREVFLRLADVRGVWGYLFPMLVVMSTSMIFELFEWAAAMVFGGELGMAYLGTQGDVWDAHRDMWLATCGTVAATLVIATVHWSLDRDFAAEWTESLRLKRPEPLGETAISALLRRKDRMRVSRFF